VSFAAITLCVASQEVFIVVVYFVIDSVRNLLVTPSYVCTSLMTCVLFCLLTAFALLFASLTSLLFSFVLGGVGARETPKLLPSFARCCLYKGKVRAEADREVACVS
jgi:hypothetical protein